MNFALVMNTTSRETTDSEVVHALEPIFHRCRNKTAYVLILKYTNYEQMYQKVTSKNCNVTIES